MKTVIPLHILIFASLWGFMVYTVTFKPTPELPLEETLFSAERFEVLDSDPETRQATLLKEGQALRAHVALQDQPLVTPGRILRGHFFKQDDALWVDQLWPADPEHDRVLEAFAYKRRKDRVSRGPIHPGKRLPSFLLYNTQGELVDEQHFMGQPLILSFFFSRCQVPEMCPTTLKRFQELQSLAAQQPKPVRLVLISLDPDYDTPGLLAHFASRMGFDPSQTSLLTGPLPWVQALGNSLGIASQDEEGTLVHNLITCLVDSQGILRHRMTTNTWSAQKVLKLALE